MPPAAEKIAPNIEWLSDYQKNIGCGIKVITKYKGYGSHRLVPHLFYHKNYAIHHRNLKFRVGLGVKATAVHKALSFNQAAWLKPYTHF